MAVETRGMKRKAEHVADTSPSPASLSAPQKKQVVAQATNKPVTWSTMQSAVALTRPSPTKRTNARSVFPLGNLPAEIMLNVCDSLDPSSVVKLARTCKDFKALIMDLYEQPLYGNAARRAADPASVLDRFPDNFFRWAIDGSKPYHFSAVEKYLRAGGPLTVANVLKSVLSDPISFRGQLELYPLFNSDFSHPCPSPDKLGKERGGAPYYVTCFEALVRTRRDRPPELNLQWLNVLLTKASDDAANTATVLSLQVLMVRDMLRYGAFDRETTPHRIRLLLQRGILGRVLLPTDAAETDPIGSRAFTKADMRAGIYAIRAIINRPMTSDKDRYNGTRMLVWDAAQDSKAVAWLARYIARTAILHGFRTRLWDDWVRNDFERRGMLVRFARQRRPRGGGPPPSDFYSYSDSLGFRYTADVVRTGYAEADVDFMVNHKGTDIDAAERLDWLFARMSGECIDYIVDDEIDYIDTADYLLWRLSRHFA